MGRVQRLFVLIGEGLHALEISVIEILAFSLGFERQEEICNYLKASLVTVFSLPLDNKLSLV